MITSEKNKWRQAIRNYGMSAFPSASDSSLGTFDSSNHKLPLSTLDFYLCLLFLLSHSLRTDIVLREGRADLIESDNLIN